MLNRLRSHISGNAIGYLALFVALGGTSYAFATGSIDSREIKNNSVRTRDLRNNDIRSRDIRNRTLVGRDHLNNSLGGDQIAEQRLGKVPSSTSADNALALGGVPAAGFVKGTALNRTISVEDENPETELLNVPGYGTFSVGPQGCEIDNPNPALELSYLPDVDQDAFIVSVANGGPGVGSQEFTANTPVPIDVNDPDLHLVFRLVRDTSPADAASVTLHLRIGVPFGDNCRISVGASVSG